LVPERAGSVDGAPLESAHSSVNSRSALPLLRRHVHTDPVEEIIELALVYLNGHVALGACLGNPERAAVEALVEQA